MTETGVSITETGFMEAYGKKVLEVQDVCRQGEQVEMPLLHDFAPGLYLRRILMKKGTFVMGKTHRTEHFNIILAGAANVMVDGEVKLIQQGDVFVSKAGVKKILYILEDMIWATTHPTDETDLEKLEELCILSDEEERKLLMGGKL